MKGKLIIISAPSGAGKSTIIRHLLTQNIPFAFSISATSRAPRPTEKHGHDYYYLSLEEFKEKIAADEFLEYEEVYKETFYGTLKSEVKRITDEGKYVLFDVDVVGGCRIKNAYGNNALSLFIQPPSIEELRRRLINRQSDPPEEIERRVEKAAYELTFAPQFDHIIINDDLERAKEETLAVIQQFLKRAPIEK